MMALLRVNGVGRMDPITLIVTALAAGAALGAQDTVSAMVKDAYAGLKVLVRKRLGGGPGAEPRRGSGAECMHPGAEGVLQGRAGAR